MRRTTLAELQPGDVLGRTLYNERGDALLKKGIILTPRYIELLGLHGFTYAYVQDPDTADIEIEDVVSDRVRTSATQNVYRYLAVLDRARRKLNAESTADIQSAEFRRQAGDELVYVALYDAVEAIIDEVLEAPILTGLTAIKTHDNYTFCHSVDMAITAVMIGKKLFLDRSALRQLALGCLLHDAGKVFIDSRILNKPGKLTPEEFAEIKKHPKLGYDLLRSLQKDELLANHVAFQHHERQDGAGYPRGLHGYNRIGRNGTYGNGSILLIAEIAAVADVYDALASDRPYRNGLPPDKIVDILREQAGPGLNREVVAHFLTVLPVYPLGIEVVVQTGRYRYYRGVVCKVHERALDRPVVRLLWNVKRQRIPPLEIDLTAETDVMIAAVPF